MTEHPHLGLCHARADGTRGYQDLPPMSWVVNTLLPQAWDQAHWREERFARSVVAYGAGWGPSYRTLDVSWRKRQRLMPFLACCVDNNDNSSSPQGGGGGAAAAHRNALGALERCAWRALRVRPGQLPSAQGVAHRQCREEGRPREGEQLAQGLEAALRALWKPTVAAAAATASGSSPESSDDSRGSRLKRARHH
ncbi:hypothetical protein PG994_007254 [Apiospora phragmitis]|uniref:Uncharacterized protein n=1 Tax=Apiospora phragmitis TaxID=2905665 RepID=A0ABR1V0C2_9PEZI